MSKPSILFVDMNFVTLTPCWSTECNILQHFVVPEMRLQKGLYFLKGMKRLAKETNIFKVEISNLSKSFFL